MSNDSDPLTVRRSLAVAVIVFGAAFGLHGIDHLRRGMAASPPSIMVGGIIQGIFVVVAVMLILRHHPWASAAAIAVGLGSAVLFIYARLLPTFLPSFQGSFVSGPRINVTWFSWLTAVGEIGTGLVLGYVGLQARRRSAVGLSVPGRRETPWPHDRPANATNHLARQDITNAAH